MNKVFKFYSDSGHGWLAVKKNVLLDLGLVDSVSPSSYMKGQTVYLEEDRDMQLFKTAYEAKYGLLSTTEITHGERSWVRNMGAYTVASLTAPVQETETSEVNLQK